MRLGCTTINEITIIGFVSRSAEAAAWLYTVASRERCRPVGSERSTPGGPARRKAAFGVEAMPVDLIFTRLTADPEVRSGQLVVRGTSVTVWEILGCLGSGISEGDILCRYPELTTEDIRAALQYAYHLKDKVFQ